MLILFALKYIWLFRSIYLDIKSLKKIDISSHFFFLKSGQMSDKNHNKKVKISFP